MSIRTLGAFILILACVGSVYSQETTTTQPPQNTTATSQTAQQPSTTSTQPAAATSGYVFPDRNARFKRYVNSTIGPLRLARSGVSAGIKQWRDSPEEWGQGMEGYGKRYASSLGRNAIQQTVTYGLDEALNLDTGFQRSRREGFLPRFKDALLQNVTSRNRRGDRVISVPRFAGVYTGAIVAHEAWYPDRYSYKDGLRSGTTTILTGFGINLFREFVFDW